eukprot:9283886-Alexandrium_andersonii.AAC.1
MSASLVGSEMCIRDRSRLVRFHPKRSALLGACPSAWVAMLPAAALSSCLLYTSDAADDSSV